jgi:two-component system LytT family response regulator
MMVVKVIIAEDDPIMQQILRKVLEGIENIKVIHVVNEGCALLEAVEELMPDVIFVDVDMPKMDGVSASKEIMDIDPKIFIIFATAYTSYTQEAFAVYAFDYLLKPYKLKRIAETMERVKRIIRERNLAKLYEKNTHGNYSIKKLIIHDHHNLLFLDVDNIIMLTRSGRKTQIHLTGEKVVNTSEPLGKLERRLDCLNFFRTHKGYIINLNMLVEVSPWGKASYELKLANTRETALATVEKIQELKVRFGRM